MKQKTLFVAAAAAEAKAAATSVCPRCGSREPHLHPSTGFEGECEICIDDFHLRATAQNGPRQMRLVHEKRRSLAEAKAAGWKLVPVEPTDEMLAALWEAMFDDKWNGTQGPAAFATYSAMLAASPSPEALPASGAEAIAVLRFDRATPGNENEVPRVISCNWLPDGEYPVFLAKPASEPAGGGEVSDAVKEHGMKALPEDVCLRMEREARNLSNLWANGDEPVRRAALALQVRTHVAALSSPASSSPAEWVKFGPSEDGIKAKAKRQARLEAEALPAAPAAPAADHVWFSQAFRDVGAERRRQVEVEGFDYGHDDAHTRGEMVKAAVSYGTHAFVRIELEARGEDPARIDQMAREMAPPRTWPWEPRWWKPGSTRRCLVKVAALIIGEIERLDRKAVRDGE